MLRGSKTCPTQGKKKAQMLSFIFHVEWNCYLCPFWLGFDDGDMNSFWSAGFSERSLTWVYPEWNRKVFVLSKMTFLCHLPWSWSCFRRNKHKGKWNEMKINIFVCMRRSCSVRLKKIPCIKAAHNKNCPLKNHNFSDRSAFKDFH